MDSWNGTSILGTPWKPHIVVTDFAAWPGHDKNNESWYFMDGQMIREDSNSMGNGWMPLHVVVLLFLFDIHGPGRHIFAMLSVPMFWWTSVLGQFVSCPHSYIVVADSSIVLLANIWPEKRWERKKLTLSWYCQIRFNTFTYLKIMAF